MKLVYRKYKKRRSGPCNICGKNGPLTWDHVPPKGGIELEAVEIDRAAGAFVPSLSVEKPEISQNGLKFRTLCGECNNDLLGARFDTALNDFAQAVGRFLRTPLELPSVLHVEAQPTAIARAVLGHVTAARLSEHPGLFDPLVEQLLRSESVPIPSDINIFYWIYPYAQQVVLRDALMPAVRGRYRDFQRFGLLKYFPIAYLVTTASAYEGLEALTRWRNEPATSTIELPVNLGGAREPYWPEAPAPDNWLFGGQDLMESIRAHPKPQIFKQVQLRG